MNYLELQQGTPEWHEARAKHFTASEAPVMMGVSKYMKRNELMQQKATGEVAEVNQAQRFIFEKGHKAEDLARPIAERIIGEELFPATISNEVNNLPLLASMDGITMLGDAGWEHKLWNEELANTVKSGEVPETHWPQLEHQAIVSGVDRILFMVSDGTEDNCAHTWYEPQSARSKKVVSGWVQFAEDLSTYVPAENVEAVEAEPIRDLPAIRYQMNGLDLQSNLNAYKDAADALVEQSKKPLESDQDFANAESRQKVFTKAEKEIKEACERVMGEIDSIDTFVKDMRYIAENIRQARLAEAKQIKAQKDKIRLDIINESQKSISEAVATAEQKVKASFPRLDADIQQAIKGKKTVASLKSAADDEVAKAKIQINDLLEVARANYAAIQEQSDYKFLFNDWQQIAFKANDDFAALVTSRVSTYQAEQKEKEEAERERIRKEEAARLQREADEKAQAEARAQREAEQKATAEKAEAQQQEQAHEQAEEVQPEPEAQPATEVVRQAPTKRQLSMMEVNGIVQFVASVTSAEQSQFASELQKRADNYIQQNTKAAA